MADALEATDAQLDAFSDEIFADGEARDEISGGTSAWRRALWRARRRARPTDFQAVVKRLGRTNSLAGKLCENLLSIPSSSASSSA